MSISVSGDDGVTTDMIGDEIKVGQDTYTLTPLGDDPADWPCHISDKQRLDIVERGAPNQMRNGEYPVNAVNRRFTVVHYYRTMPNREQVRRTWLIYSAKNDSIYCFVCLLFGTHDVPLRNGTRKWEGLSKN